MRNLRPILFALMAVILVTCGFNQMSDKNVICEEVYALCSSAPCIPDPKDPSKAICHCEVLTGHSYGHTSCADRKPTKNQYGVQSITSTYSFHDLATNSIMTCPKGKPWTNCLDRPCTIDPLDPSVAICKCDIDRTQASVTCGGHCDTSPCDTGYRPGPTLDGKTAAKSYFSKALGINPRINYCPGSEPHASQ